MDFDKTRVPGMESQDNFYSRPSGQALGGRQATVVPGMQPAEARGGFDGGGNIDNGAPVVGFLYSVSRGGVPEYWPVRLGANTIGRDPQCDIRLEENTVSGLHATLNVKQLKMDHRVLAMIRDEGSKNGIIINSAEELDYSSHEVKNGDVLLIGNAYSLLLVLVNAHEAGLAAADNFEPSAPRGAADDFGRAPFREDSTNAFYDPRNRSAGGTVSLDNPVNFDGGDTRFI